MGYLVPAAGLGGRGGRGGGWGFGAVGGGGFCATCRLVSFASAPSVVEFGVPQMFEGESKIAVGFACWESLVFCFLRALYSYSLLGERVIILFFVFQGGRDKQESCASAWARDPRVVPLAMPFGARLIRCRGRVEGVWGRLRNLPVLGCALQVLLAAALVKLLPRTRESIYINNSLLCG